MQASPNTIGEGPLGAHGYLGRDQMVRWQNWTDKPQEAARGIRKAPSAEQTAGAWQNAVMGVTACPTVTLSVAR
jgi:hypothetical protein